MEFNVDPYYDDFEQNAKENNYLKILFKPGASVQARELTQIQSILQNQIKSLSDHIFQDGSPVIGGNLTLDNKITYLKLDDTFNNEDIELDLFNGKVIIRDSDSLVQAKVLATYFPAGGSPTLMVKYVSGVEFDDGDVFRVAGTITKAKCVDSQASGKGTVVSINEGIFYVDGYFIQVGEQTTVVSAYSQTANAKIGLEISDEIVDSVVDSTLLDPAQQSFNYQAPGADRYQFNLTLSTRPLDTAIDESSFFELMRIESGAITKQVKYPIYSEIEKTLARRTFDESGDYTVTPFRASVSKSQDANNYIINIEPGKAYVKGFEFETLGTFKMEVPKPRGASDQKSVIDLDFDTSYGNYIKVRDVYGSANGNSFLDVVSLEKVDLHCVDSASVNVGITSPLTGAVVGAAADFAAYANTKIGTARVRAIKRDTPSGNTAADSQGVYNFYLTDVDVRPKTIRMNVASGLTSTTINLTSNASRKDNAYQNVTITVLPILLNNVANVSTADLYANGYIFANSAVSSTFASPNVSVGDIIRIEDYVRQVVRVSNDYLVVNSGFQANITGRDLQVFVQSPYTSNVTGQTRKIISYVGATQIATLDRPFDEGSVPTRNNVVQLNFALKDLESLMEANVSVPVVNVHANVSVQSKLIDGETVLFENDDKTLIYRLPKNYVKRGSLDNIDYNHIKYVQKAVDVGAPGVFTVSLESYETIPWSVTNSNIQDNLICIPRNHSTPASGEPANGEVITLTTANVSEVVGGLEIDTGLTTLNDLDILVTTKVNDAEGNVRSKTYRSNTTYTLSPFNYPSVSDVNIDHTVTMPAYGDAVKINVAHGLVFVTEANVTNIFPGDSINLFVPDVVQVRRILSGNTTIHANSTVYTDITDHFLIDYGQKDDIYDHAKLILKQGYPSPNAKLTVHLDFFQHTYPAGATFFSVDSYNSTLDDAGEIPVYYSSKNGVFVLRDCLDFRPTKRIGTLDTIDTGLLPAPDASTELSFDYYLPRIDKLVVSKTKEFRIIQGVSAPKPVAPPDDDDSMTLYVIYLPPYVNSINDIRLKYVENKRYTMRDIAKIDKRVDRVEYYTALNSIENKALDDTSQYEDGTEKEKFGIIGENFRNFNIADYRNPDFNCSMVRNALTPFFKNKVLGTKLVGTDSARENQRTITLDYTETPAVKQEIASDKKITVQPFLFGTFIGDLRITPEVDYWISTELKPEIIQEPEYTPEVAPEAVKEITNTMVIVERVKDRLVIVTVPECAVNNSPALIEVPRTDPPPKRQEDDRPVGRNRPPPVVPDEPSSSRKAILLDPDPQNESVPDILAPFFIPAAADFEQHPYEPPPPESDIESTIGTSRLVASTTSKKTFSGGCVALESYVPMIDDNMVNNGPVTQAYQLNRTHKLMLCNLEELNNIVGTVKDAFIDYQVCHRLVTESGASLVCSDTAPIPTLNNGIKKPPELVGEMIPVLRSGAIIWERVVSNENVGYKFVRVIDAHDNYFWAGETSDAYILHHNITSKFKVADISYEKD